MSNDDLGQFPMPSKPQVSADPATPIDTSASTQPASNVLEYHDPFAPKPAVPPTDPTPSVEPVVEQVPSFEDLTTPSPDVVDAPAPAFEETPDEIPSVQTFSEPDTQSHDFAPSESPAPDETDFIEPEKNTDSSLNELTTEPTTTPDVEDGFSEPIPEMIQATAEPELAATPEPATPSTPIQAQEAQLATAIPQNSKSVAPLLFIGLLLIAGLGLATSVFLFSQSSQLKRQLTDITQTIDRQNTTLTPTPTSTPIEVITPTLTPMPTPDATASASISATPILTPTPAIIASAMPLQYAREALKVGINKQPNAQMILIKVENASDPANSITKYFFRQDLKTKKYFYVTILNKSEPAVIDKAIYVTPDNDIPSLNEAVSTQDFGIDLDAALKIAYDACESNLCQTAALKAQFIKSNTSFIWQLAFTPQDTTKTQLVVQINSQTKEILYKSPGF